MMPNKKLRFIVMLLLSILHRSNGSSIPTRSKRGTEDDGQEQQVQPSCPTNQFFSNFLKTCRDCDRFCDGIMIDRNCKSQCKTIIPKKNNEKEIDNKNDEGVSVRAGSEDSKTKERVAASIALFVTIAVIALFIIKRRNSRKQANVQGNPQQGPEDIELVVQGAQNEGANQRTNVSIAPPESDSKPLTPHQSDNYNTETSTRKCFCSSNNLYQEDDTTNKRYSEQPDDNIQEELGLVSGMPTVK